MIVSRKKETKKSGTTYCKNRANEDPVEFLERIFVGGSEGGRKLLRLVGLTVLQSLAGKREATEEPHQALGSGSLLFAFFVFDQLFEGTREGGGSVISGADFL